MNNSSNNNCAVSKKESESSLAQYKKVDIDRLKKNMITDRGEEISKLDKDMKLPPQDKNEDLFDKVLSQVHKKNSIRKKKKGNEEEFNVSYSISKNEKDNSSYIKDFSEKEGIVKKSENENKSKSENKPKPSMIDDDMKELEKKLLSNKNKKNQLLEKSKVMRKDLERVSDSEERIREKDYNQNYNYNKKKSFIYDENNDLKTEENLKISNQAEKKLSLEFLEEKKKESFTKTSTNNTSNISKPLIKSKESNKNPWIVEEEKSSKLGQSKTQNQNQPHPVKKLKGTSTMIKKNNKNEVAVMESQFDNIDFLPADEEDQNNVLDMLENVSNTRDVFVHKKDKDKKKTGVDSFYSNIVKPFKCGNDDDD